jgi:hypothetical protein
MSQEQRLVPLVLRAGPQRQAVATGNNAAWQCSCGRSLPLLGRSGSLSGVSEARRVDCPNCRRQYFVVPEDKDRGRVLKVKEVT